MNDIVPDFRNDFQGRLKVSANKLSPNIEKTKSMLICNRRSPLRNFSLDITAQTHPIESVDTMKYLGLYIDRFLTYDAHTDKK